MGQSESSFKRTYEETVCQLSSVQMGEISRRFNELYAKAGGPKGHVVDREAFSKYFNLPVAVGDRLFDAFDEKKNGKISFEEFVCGLAVVLHGSFHDRCMLLFRVFNLNEDEGISRTELAAMLTHILHSTHTILHTIGEGETALMSGEDTHETVKRMVDAAFTNCDISRTGKLLPLEFEYWLKRNPKILDSLLSFKTKEKVCTLGPLIMSPSEQLFSVTASQEGQLAGGQGRQGGGGTTGGPGTPVEVVTRRAAASPTLFQIGGPSLEGEEEREEEREEKEEKREMEQESKEDGKESSAITTNELTQQPSTEQGRGNDDVTEHGVEAEEQASDDIIEQGVEESGDDIIIEQGVEEQGNDDVTVAVQEGVASSESTDTGAGSIMLAESNLSIDMSCVARATSSDKLGSPVLPTTSLEEVAIATGEPQQPRENSSLLLMTNKSPEKEAEPSGAETPPTFVADDLERVEEELEGVHLTPSISDSVPDVTIDLEEGVEEGVEPVFTEEEELAREGDAPTSLEQQVLSSSLPIGVKDVGGGETLSEEGEREGEREGEGEISIREELYTAWVATPQTQRLLAQAQPTKDPNYLTCPALVADVRMNDAVSELLSTHYPDSARKTQLTVEQVTMDTQGLRRLISCGCLHAAVELTARFLSAHGQGLGQAGQPTVHTHKTLQMWCARISLLMHLGLFQEAERELVAFEELANPDLYYQYHAHSYPNKTGSMVPFTLRLLHAQLPAYQNSIQLSLDRLCELQSICERILAELNHGKLPNQPHPLMSHDQQVAVSLWRKRLARVKCAMANTFTAIQDYHMAAEVYNSLLELLPQQRVEIQSVIGRMYLQLGDLKSAQMYFSRVIKSCDSQEQENSHHQAIIKINEGLVNVFLSRWQIARECFEEASRLDPSNLAIQSNTTVCTFYQGKLKEAIGEMERFVRSDPPRTLQPAVFGNLAAAYELESGNSLARKVTFVPLLAAHVGDAFSINSLNIR